MRERPTNGLAVLAASVDLFVARVTEGQLWIVLRGLIGHRNWYKPGQMESRYGQCPVILLITHHSEILVRETCYESDSGSIRYFSPRYRKLLLKCVNNTEFNFS